MDLTHVDRQAYHILDLLGDVGGLVEALLYIFTFLLAFINYGKFDTMMYRYIFMTTKDSGETPVNGGNDGQPPPNRKPDIKEPSAEKKFVETNEVDKKSIIRSPAL